MDKIKNKTDFVDLISILIESNLMDNDPLKVIEIKKTDDDECAGMPSTKE